MYFTHKVFSYKVTSKVTFTNLKCTSTDESFSSFEYCYLKAVNRSYKYISLKVNLHKIPVYKIKSNISILKRANGYKPFLYNVTVDFCKFMSRPKSNPIFKYLFDFFSSSSNFNHSCPYKHDIIIDKLSTQFLDVHVTKTLPVPEGDYLFETHWFVNGIHRAVVRAYSTIS
ncbi:hypothetical protein KR018_002935 [Drosophila ironensis]|nr:hypothetical protein KR018_002935 [Drosophila ironensis]